MAKTPSFDRDKRKSSSQSNRKKSSSDRRADNPLKFGLQSKRDVLPWENHSHFTSLHKSLIQEFSPRGVVERHLVGEIALIIWRKRRIGPAESAAFHLAMLKPPKPLIEAAETILPDLRKASFMEKIAGIEETVEGIEHPEHGNAAVHRQHSRNVDAEQLVLLGRYEAHLDRKFQRTVTMLLSLQRVRKESLEPPANSE